MAGQNSQQRGKEQRGEQERSSQISYPGRSTYNSRRASGGSKASDKKQILNKALPRQQSTTAPSGTWDCTSPQLNLQIPGPQTRSRYQPQNPRGQVKTMKRHTSPYPTPASSPNGDVRLDGLSAPQRSGSCPGPTTLDLTGKYKEKMGVFLQSIRPRLGGDGAAGSEPVPANGMEANPVPDFFVNPTHVEAATTKFGGSWMSGMSESPERELMDNEFIGTLGSVQDLDEDMRDWLPDTGFSEFMPGPEEPIMEATMPIVMLQSMDLDREAGPVEVQESAVTPANKRRMESNLFLNTPQSSATDSGIGSPGSTTNQLFTPVTGEDAREMNASVNSSIAATLGISEAGLAGNSQMSFGSTFFGEAGELTPPSSAHRSPSPLSAFFIGKEPMKKLASESVEIIETMILDSIVSNPALPEFSTLCELVRRQMHAGKFRSLRDVEKDLWFRGQMVATSSSSGQLFCFESMNRIREASARIPEHDLYRQGDLVYCESYFTDKFAEIEQIYVDSVKWNDSHQKRIQPPAQVESPKRKLFSTTHMVSKRPMVAAGSRRPLTSAPVLGQPVHSRQQLEIQTQALVQPLYRLPHGNFPTAGSTFTIDQRTNNAVVQAQYHNSRVYRNSGSEVLVSSASFPAQAAAYCLPPTPVSAVSAASAGFAFSPAVTPASVASAASSPAAVRHNGTAPVFSPGTGEEPPTLCCGLCEKRFPRRCDLTKHEKTHARPFKCEFQSCKYHGEGFPTNKERERHQNDIHASDSKEWRCEYPPCVYKSKRESNCKQHMEKAHGYEYKRMKRNPRKQNHRVPLSVPVRNRRNVRAAPMALPRASLVAQRPSASMVLPRDQLQMSAHLQEQDQFSAPFGYPRVSELDHINSLGSGQIQAIDDDIYAVPMEIDPSYGVSHATAAGSAFENYNTALHGLPENSPTLSSENYSPTQSTEYADFISNFTDSFGAAQSACSQSVDFQFSGLDFEESSDYEQRGETPD